MGSNDQILPFECRFWRNLPKKREEERKEEISTQSKQNGEIIRITRDKV